MLPRKPLIVRRSYVVRLKPFKAIRSPSLLKSKTLKLDCLEGGGEEPGLVWPSAKLRISIKLT